jgi:Ran GTPase-activating protein (RanGAP) involved in mRNA processing and transport
MTINDSIKLANAMEASSITTLSIPASGIDDDQCRVLCHSLLKNKTVTHLDLSNNKIKDQGARALATLLAAGTPPLVELKLCNNKIGPDSGSVLGKSLVANTTLKLLDLRLDRNPCLI